MRRRMKEQTGKEKGKDTRKEIGEKEANTDKVME